MLGGCAAGERWTRDDVDATTLRQDELDCLREARNQAEREAFARPDRLQAPVISVDRTTGQVRETFRSERAAVTLDEAARRQQLFVACMRKHGYRLVKDGS